MLVDIANFEEYVESEQYKNTSKAILRKNLNNILKNIRNSNDLELSVKVIKNIFVIGLSKCNQSYNFNSVTNLLTNQINLLDFFIKNYSNFIKDNINEINKFLLKYDSSCFLIVYISRALDIDIDFSVLKLKINHIYNLIDYRDRLIDYINENINSRMNKLLCFIKINNGSELLNEYIINLLHSLTKEDIENDYNKRLRYYYRNRVVYLNTNLSKEINLLKESFEYLTTYYSEEYNQILNTIKINYPMYFEDERNKDYEEFKQKDDLLKEVHL